MSVTRVIHITPPPEIDQLLNLADFERAVLDALEQAPDVLVVDFGDVEFMDASAVKVLVAADKALRESGGRLALRHVPPTMRRVFEAVETAIDDQQDPPPPAGG